MERLFWFRWRDPPRLAGGHVQLLRQRGALEVQPDARSPPTPRSRASRPRPPRPQASITAGPRQGGLHQRPDPALLASPRTRPARPSSAASTEGPSGPAARRTQPRSLPDGAHTLFVKAIDAPGNVSAGRVAALHRRHPGPAVTMTPPVPRAARPHPIGAASFSFASNESGASFSCRLDGGGFDDCSSPFTVSDLADAVAHLPGQGSGSGRKRRPDHLPHLERRQPGRPLHHRRPRKRRPHQRLRPRASPSPPRTRAPASAASSTAAGLPPARRRSRPRRSRTASTGSPSR